VNCSLPPPDPTPIDLAAARILNFHTSYARRLVDDVPDHVLAERPAPGMNHAAFLLGHLAFAADQSLALLGRPCRMGDDASRRRFGWRVELSLKREDYPAKTVLLANLADAHDRLARACLEAPADLLAGPHPLDDWAETLPTRRDVLVYTMTGHAATHLGQLSAWRRAMGYPPARYP